MDAVLLEDDDPLDLADGRADRVQNVLKQKQTDYIQFVLIEKRQFITTMKSVRKLMSSKFSLLSIF